jgi:hypothetical protein
MFRPLAHGSARVPVEMGHLSVSTDVLSSLHFAHNLPQKRRKKKKKKKKKRKETRHV